MIELTFISGKKFLLHESKILDVEEHEKGSIINTEKVDYKVKESVQEIKELINPPQQYDPSVYSFGEQIMLMQT